MLVSEILYRAKYTLSPCRWARGYDYIEKGEKHIRVLPYINVKMIADPEFSNLDFTSNFVPICYIPAMSTEASKGTQALKTYNNDLRLALTDSYNSDLLPHFVLGLAQFNCDFNRSVFTSFEDLIIKFDQAIDIAKKLGI